MAIDPEELKRLVAQFASVNADPEGDASVESARQERRGLAQAAVGSRTISDLTRAFMPLGSQGPGYGQAEAMERAGDDRYAEAQGERSARAAKRQGAYPLLNQYLEGNRADASLKNAKDIASAKAQAEAQEKAAAAALQLDRDSQGRKFQMERDTANNAAALERAKVMGQNKLDAIEAKPPPNVPAGEAAELGDMAEVDKQIDALYEDWQRNGRGGALPALTQHIPGTDANSYVKTRDLNAQAIGTKLEGGKLSNSDFTDRYTKFMPTPGDTEASAERKREGLKAYARQKVAGRVRGLGAAGYNTKGLEGIVPQAPAAGVRMAPPGGVSPGLWTLPRSKRPRRTAGRCSNGRLRS
jgi:hypothetical protein